MIRRRPAALVLASIVVAGCTTGGGASVGPSPTTTPISGTPAALGMDDGVAMGVPMLGVAVGDGPTEGLPPIVQPATTIDARTSAAGRRRIIEPPGSSGTAGRVPARARPVRPAIVTR